MPSVVPPLEALPLDKRSLPRAAVGLPVLFVWEGARRSALLRDISRGGARIDTAVPLNVGDKIELHCGSICIEAVVLWRRTNGFGLEFARPIEEAQLAEQILRAEIGAKWREGRATALAKLVLK